MSSFSEEERAREWVLDIVEYGDRIARYLEGRGLEGDMVRDAVERCVLVITAAAVRLGPDRLKRIAPDLRLQELRGLGNLLRHGYQRISVEVMWNRATAHVPALREACARALQAEAW